MYEPPRIWGIFKRDKGGEYFCSELIRNQEEVYGMIDESKETTKLSILQAMEVIGSMSKRKLITNMTVPEDYVEFLPELSIATMPNIKDFASELPNEKVGIVIIKCFGLFQMHRYSKESIFGKKVLEVLADPLRQAVVTTAEMMDTVDVCKMIRCLNAGLLVNEEGKLCRGFGLEIAPTLVKEVVTVVRKNNVNGDGDNILLPTCKATQLEFHDGRIFDSSFDDGDDDPENPCVKIPATVITKIPRLKNQEEIDEGKVLVAASDWEETFM